MGNGQHLANFSFSKYSNIDKSSSNKNAIRGREQQMIIKNGRAKSEKGTSGNAYNGISPKNKKYSKYIKAATKEFGKP